MARSPIDLRSGALHDAIDKSKNLFRAPIDRIEYTDGDIHVDAGGQRIVYTIINSEQDELSEDGKFRPFVGGVSLELVHFSGPLPILTVSGLWQRLKARLGAYGGRSIQP
jgi:hypothetical protein